MTMMDATRGARADQMTPALQNANVRLPNFVVAGILKGGTTSLNFSLKQHPQIYMCPMKEPRYFVYESNNPDHVEGRGLHFPIKTWEQYVALFAGAGDQPVVGEVSPHYMISPIAPQGIHDRLPDVRLLFSLRQPVKRAYSVYWHQVRLGNENRPVEEALGEHEYAVTHGLYARWLRNWYALFAPEQIKVVLFDDWQRDPQGTYADICRFLEIDDTFVPDMTVRNKGGAMKNARLGRFYERLKKHPLRHAFDPLVPQRVRSALIKTHDQNLQEPPPMPPALQQRLNAFYREDIAELEQMLQRDLSAWRG